MKKNILVVDDSESIREVVSTALEEAGYETTKAIDGQDGLVKLHAAQDIRLVISDLNMPNMDGISFLKEVRQIEKFKYLPIVILTTEAQETKKRAAQKAGATGWIIKPFEQNKLIAIVKKVLG